MRGVIGHHEDTHVVVVLAAALGTVACSESSAETPAGSPPFSVVFQDLEEGLMSVWGRSETDVFAVGSDLGQGPLVLHYDGSAWKRLPTSTTGHLWWVHGFADGPVLMGGAGGTILRWDGTSFVEDATPGALTVYGIWGSSQTDVWAVGGAGPDGAFAWHFDGSIWSDVPLPAGIRETVSLFKVWGRATDDAWFVGSKGTTLHWDGSNVTQVESGSSRTLFTVHDDGTRSTAVGGQGDGVILEHDGTSWKDVTPPAGKVPVFGVNGVFTTPDGGYASGEFGTVLRRKSGVWETIDHGLDVVDTLHAVWIDPAGGVWAVGGQVQAEPIGDGVMIHAGADVPGGSYSQ